MHWHDEIIKREEPTKWNMKTEHQQLRDMMEELGYGRNKFFQKLTAILNKSKLESVKVRLRPSNLFPNDFRLALWVYKKMSRKNK